MSRRNRPGPWQQKSPAAQMEARLATPDDVEGLVRLARNLHAENGIGELPLSEKKVRAFIDRALNGHLVIIYVIGPPDDIHAAIGLVIEEGWYSDEWHLYEMFMFVDPKHRSPPGAARLLIRMAKQAADKLKLPLMVGVISTERTEAKIRLYETELSKAGAFFLYGSRSVGNGQQDSH